LTETSQSLQWSDGSFWIFFNPFFDRDGSGDLHWIAPIISWIAIVLLVMPLINLLRKKMRNNG